jgi:hypothetical protein
MYGLEGTKGNIAPRCDVDLLIWNPEGQLKNKVTIKTRPSASRRGIYPVSFYVYDLAPITLSSLGIPSRNFADFLIM